MKYTKLISLIMAAVLLLTTAPLAFAAAPTGDLDGDGEVMPADARIALRCSVKLETATPEQVAAGDMDYDGNLTSADARLILRLAVGLPINGEDISDPADDPANQYSDRYELFKTKLYEVSHPLVGTYKTAFAYGPLKNFQKWCCLYTIHDVFRPTLQQCGYSQEQINKLAPNKYTKQQLAKALKGGLGINWPEALIPSDVEYYVPSLLMNHYYNNPDACRVYHFFDYYDDVVEQRMYYRDERDVTQYTPQIGDVLFMSNKTRTYDNGHPTIDHTAQIIKVYEDGTFMCTEGSIIENAENDGIAKVRERTYHYNPNIGTYEFDYNNVVIVLTAVRPFL